MFEKLKTVFNCEVNVEPFALGQLFARKALLHHGKWEGTTMQEMNAAQQWGQIGANYAQLLQMGGLSKQFEVQIGQQRLDLAQEVNGFHVKMAEKNVKI